MIPHALQKRWCGVGAWARWEVPLCNIYWALCSVLCRYYFSQSSRLLSEIGSLPRDWWRHRLWEVKQPQAYLLSSDAAMTHGPDARPYTTLLCCSCVERCSIRKQTVLFFHCAPSRKGERANSAILPATLLLLGQHSQTFLVHCCSKKSIGQEDPIHFYT